MGELKQHIRPGKVEKEKSKSNRKNKITYKRKSCMNNEHIYEPHKYRMYRNKLR
jgi:hypothetical protein